MNRIILLIGFIMIIAFFSGCNSGCSDCDFENHEIEATIIFINQTSDSIISIEGCNRDIKPNSTLTFKIKDVLGSKPSIDNFPASIFSHCTMMYKDGSNLKCERKIENILNYEDRKEISPLVFEFTFRFTEEKKASADELCLRSYE